MRPKIPGIDARSVAICLVVALASALVAPGLTLAQGPSASPTASSSPSPLEAALLDELGALTTPEALSEAALEAAATERELLGLAELDPELPAILAELETIAADDLASYVAEAPQLSDAIPDTSPEPGTSPAAGASAAADGAAPDASPEAAGRTTFLAARRTVASPAARRFDQGGSFLSSGGQMAGFIDSQIGGFQPSKDSGRLPDRPYDGTTTETVAGRQVTRSTRYAISGGYERDTVRLSVDLTERYAIPGPTPDSLPLDVTDTGQATIIIDTCPDEDGTVVASTSTQGTLDVTGPGFVRRIRFDATDRAVATVNDEARVAGVQHALDTDRKTVVGSGDDEGVRSHLAAALSWASDGAEGTTGSPSIEVRSDEGATQADVSSWLFGSAMTGALADMAIDAAERVWTDGRCLEMKADPPGKEVDPGSETEITVTIHHKAFDEEVERPVKAASLEGTESVEPLDQPVDDRTFTYTASDEPEGEGTITFQSISNRGIAEELTETYTVSQRLRLDVNGNVTFRRSGIVSRGTLRGRGLVVKLVANEDPETPPGVTVTGDLSASMRASSPGCSGSGRASYTVDAALDASATVVGEGEERRIRILLRPARPDDQLVVRVRCQGRTARLSFPLRIIWPSFQDGGAVEIPIAGGTADRSGTAQGVRSKFTFKLYQEEAGGS